jgi:hypothetical protein
MDDSSTINSTCTRCRPGSQVPKKLEGWLESGWVVGTGSERHWERPVRRLSIQFWDPKPWNLLTKWPVYASACKKAVKAPQHCLFE